MGNIAREIARLFGYDLINTRHSDLRIEHLLARIFRTLDINCVIDVGANKGQYGTLLRKMGYSGVIHSFEPLPSCQPALEQLAAQDGRWQIYPFALGSRSESRVIQVFAESMLSSFHVPTEHVNEQFPGASDVIGSEQVELRKLDDLFDKIVLGIDSPRVFLKLDTQGYDVDVFRGAATCIQHVVVLQTELSVVPLYDGMPDYVEALQTFRQVGFEPAGMYPIYRLSNEWVIGEIDCVMIKKGVKVDRKKS